MFTVTVTTPLYDPIPPIEMAARRESDMVLKEHIKPWLEEHVYSNGMGRYDLDMLSYAILYLMGYQSEMPNIPSLTEERWQAALWGMIKPPYAPMLWMIAYPSSYLNNLAEEGLVGKRLGFFSTPINVTLMMHKMINAGRKNDSSVEAFYSLDPQWELDDGNFKFAYLGKTPDERKALLTESWSDPAVGVGNMAWGFFNTKVFGEFIDINPHLARACRATFALYAPWHTHSVYRGNSLALGFTEETKNFRVEQGAEYRLEALRANAILRRYVHDQLGRMAGAKQPQVYNTAGLNSREVFAHVEARALLRTNNYRKVYWNTRFGKWLDAIKEMTSKKEVLEKAPTPPPAPDEDLVVPDAVFTKKSNYGEQISFFD